MASVTCVSATFLAGKSVVSPVAPHRSVVMASCAAAEGQNVKVSCEAKKESGTNGNGRRDLMMLAAALWSVGGKAVAEEEEPRRGSQEAKKKYAQVCVTMPTARICRY